MEKNKGIRGISKSDTGDILIYWGELKGWVNGAMYSYPHFKGRFSSKLTRSEYVTIPGEFL